MNRLFGWGGGSKEAVDSHEGCVDTDDLDDMYDDSEEELDENVDGKVKASAVAGTNNSQNLPSNEDQAEKSDNIPSNAKDFLSSDAKENDESHSQIIERKCDNGADEHRDQCNNDHNDNNLDNLESTTSESCEYDVSSSLKPVFLADEISAKAKQLVEESNIVITAEKENKISYTVGEYDKNKKHNNDADNDGRITLAEQAKEIVNNFEPATATNNSREADNDDDTRTICTQRTTGTRVQPISTAFRLAQEDVKKKWNHPHQSIFDILDRNFEELGDHFCESSDNGSGGGVRSWGGIGGIGGIGKNNIHKKKNGRSIGYLDVKLCFVAFVAVFSLPMDPIYANGNGGVGNGYEDEHENSGSEENDNHALTSATSTATITKEKIRTSVPLSVVFALWRKVLKIPERQKDVTDEVSYIRSTLVLLGFLELSEIDREDLIGSSQKFDSRTIECLKVHDEMHQQYGEYMAWGDHDASFRSTIELNEQHWNYAVMKACEEVGSNIYTLRMLPLNTMRANHMKETFELLKEKTFVRRRVRILGASGAANAHVTDVDELLRLIEERIDGDEADIEPIDEQEGVLNSYQQVKKYCLHVTNELTKHHTEVDGEDEEVIDVSALSKAALAKLADAGDAMHLIGASLGGYGFFGEEMEYYKEALRLKELSCQGNIDKSVSASDTLHCMGFSMDNVGKSEEAIEYYDRALEIRIKCLGQDDLRVAETLHNKGALLCEADKADEAMDCLEEALRIRELHHGEEHESCADTMQWMGNLLRKHGDPSEALDYFKFALRIKQARLGNDDIDVANTLFNTAVLLDDLEKYELSLIAYKEALRIRKLVLGEKNDEVADTLFCMGNVATVIESHDEALCYFKESISIREGLISEEDPTSHVIDDTLLFISNPRSLRPDLVSQYQKLIKCFEEALPLTKLLAGPNHKDVSRLLDRMGEVYKRLHDWDNAIGSFQGSLRARKEGNPEGPKDDKESALLMQRAGECHLYKNEYGRAKSIFQSALKILEQNLGRVTMPVASCTYCLGIAYYYLHDYTHSRLLFEECKRIQVQVVGENSNLVARTLCWIARQHEKLDEHDIALEKYLSALRIYKLNKSSSDFRVVIMLLHSIGKTYEDDKVNLVDLSLKCYIEEINIIQSKLDQGESETANLLSDAYFSSGLLLKKKDDLATSVEHFEKALEMAKQCDGEQSERIATIEDHLGMQYALRRELIQSKTHFSSAYRIYEQTIGRDHIVTSECAFRLGGVLEELEMDLALDFYSEALRVRQLHMSDDQKSAEIMFCLGKVYLDRSAYQDAIKLFEKSLTIRKKLLGESAAVAITYHKLGDTYFQSEQHEKALIFYGESVRINKKIDDKEALYRASLDMAHCCDEARQFQLAIECYSSCLQRTTELEDDMNAALVMKRMGEIHMNELKNYRDATKLFLDALELLRAETELDETEEEAIVSLIFQSGQAYGLSQEYETAIDYYDEYIDLVESSSVENGDLLVSDALFEKSKIYAFRFNPDFDIAIETMKECLDKKKKNHGQDDERVALVAFELAKIYEKAGLHAECIEFYAEALRVYKMKRKKAQAADVYYALAKLKSSQAVDSECSEDYDAAVECYDQGLKLRRQVMSLDDVELAPMLFDYASLLCNKRKYDDAMPLLEEALRIQKAKMGLKDACVAHTLLRMAEVHVFKKKFDASLVALEQVLFISSSFDENQVIDISLCHYLLGITYIAKENHEKAVASLLLSLEMRNVQFGPNSLECAAVHDKLGKAYGKLREFDKALESLVEALRIRKIELGNDSIDYAHSVFNLSEVHIAMGKYSQAFNCVIEAIRVFEMFPDEAGSLLLDAMVMKGDSLFQLKDYPASVAVFQEAVEMYNHFSQSYGESVATLYYKLGLACSKMNAYEEAFASFRQCIRVFSEDLGPDHLRVGDVMYDVGKLVYNHGEHGSAEKSMECFKEVMRIYSINKQQNHVRAADISVQMATIHTDLGEYDEAKDALKKALKIYEGNIGEKKSLVGKGLTLQQIGRIHYAKNEFDQALTSFTDALQIFQDTLGEKDMNVSLALSNIGIVHARKSEHEKAVEMCTKALKIRKLHFDDDQDIADSLFNIANILDDWGRKDEALILFEKALKLYQSLPGDLEISQANCQQRIGSIHLSNGNVDDALIAYLDAREICEAEHEDIEELLTSVHKGLGNCYFLQKEYDSSLKHFAKCLKLQREEIGEESMDVSSTYDCIGRLYTNQGKYAEAIDFHTKSLRIIEKHHGKGTKESASCSVLIARALFKMEKYDLCLELLQDSLKALSTAGDDCIEDVADIHHEIGLAQRKLEKFEEAATSLKTALGIRMKVHGKYNIVVANILLDFGKVLEEWKDPEEAISVYDQAITVFQKIPESNFLIIAETYVRIGELFEEKENYDSSLFSMKKALKIYSKNCGSETVIVAKTLHKLGRIYDRLDEIEKAKACFSEAVKIFRLNLGNDDILVSNSMKCLGTVYSRSNQFAKSVELCTEALRIQKNDEREKPENIADSLTNIGNILNNWNKKEQSLQFYEEALRVYEESDSADASDVANCQQIIGILQKGLGDFETALTCFGKALRGHRSAEGDKSLSVATDLYYMGMLYDSFGEAEKALQCFQECLKIRRKELEEDHLDVLAARRFVANLERKMMY